MDTITEHVLTARDTRALRHADSLCFDHNADGTGAIRAIVRADRSSTGFEQVHTIPVVSRVDNYSRGFDGPVTACYVLMYVTYDPMDQTLIRHMRAGKRVHLHWTAGNASPVLDNADLVRDELRIRIGDDKRADTYLLAVSVGRDNSARMIRRA